MKYLIFSDLHGSADAAECLIEKFFQYQCDQILCLGDVLYHGPRNDLPKSYAPKKVISLLNSVADKIICIQGNCDAEVDQMVLNFKLNPQLNLQINEKLCHLEHGHHLENKSYAVDVVLFGHTHIPVLEVRDSVLYINPGSITLPKGHYPPTFVIWDSYHITLYDKDDTILKQITLSK